MRYALTLLLLALAGCHGTPDDSADAVPRHLPELY